MAKAYCQAAAYDVVGAEFGPEEVVLGGAVDDVGVFLDVAHLEQLGGEFAVFFIFIDTLFCFATNLS